ncbi:flagellar hook-associated protein FlgL [Algicola sagamiensis]|uniref:flagellar hook-associated protein FlgL n=1 Tax=Algicola sagamiensis TaxID=163869 RepID=UPI00035EB0D9|nr:flagellar hook-associated protein FlgL [Algicola sagamiensis]
MRLSTKQIFNLNVQEGILNSQNRLNTATERMIKQTRLLTPADSPADAALALRYTENIQKVDQFQQNGIQLKNALQNEESVIQNIKTTLFNARTKAVQAGNGANSDKDRASIAQELRSIRDQLFDLMNSKDSNGDFIFSGFQSNKQPFVLNGATGKYEYKGDEGQKELKVSSSVTLASNDSGKEVFEEVASRLKTANTTFTGGITGGSVFVAEQGVFDDYHKANFDKTTATNNDFRIVLTAPNNYDILKGGVSQTTGTFNFDEPIDFQGLEITPTAGAVPGEIRFSFSTPGKQNILDTMEELIVRLESEVGQTLALKDELSDAMVQIDNTLDSVMATQSSIGGRMNVADGIFAANAELNITNQVARANVAEIDFNEAMTDIVKEQTALTAAQQAFARLSGLSLFNFL